MKLTKITNLLVLGSALTITAVGCKTHPQNPTPLPGTRTHLNDQQLPNGGQPFNNPPPIVDTTPPTGIPTTPGEKYANYGDDRVTLQQATVYFDFDKSAIKASEAAKLEDVANYMKGNQSVGLRVEGNCDERGTEEYNRALGERRALSAREHLVSLGVDAGRIITLTKGEDNPADPGHSESAWSKNRRDEFVVLTPPKP
jgi:peptidoglycan-associated lipoprotein